MDRIKFLTKASEFFNTPFDKDTYEGLMQYTVSGFEAERLYELNKHTNRLNRSEEKELFLLNNSKIHDFLNTLGLSIEVEDLKGNLYFRDYFDHYALEDDDELAFNIKFNINQLYDLLSFPNLDRDLIDIYRLESSSGEGVYNTCRVYSEDPKLNPAPDFDDNINLIFSFKRSSAEGYESGYRKKWFFGFTDKEDILKWFHSEKDHKDFIDKNMQIVHYQISKKFIVESDKQVVFLKEKSDKKRSISFQEHYEQPSINEFLQQKIESTSLNKKNKIKI